MEIVQFLRDNWSFISTGILVILSFVLMIIKRRPSSIDEFLKIIYEMLAKIPEFIMKAESNYDDADIKYNFVINKCLDYVKIHYRLLTAEESNIVKEYADKFLEQVLFCPTKKGGFGRE